MLLFFFFCSEDVKWRVSTNGQLEIFLKFYKFFWHAKLKVNTEIKKINIQCFLFHTFMNANDQHNFLSNIFMFLMDSYTQIGKEIAEISQPTEQFTDCMTQRHALHECLIKLFYLWKFFWNLRTFFLHQPLPSDAVYSHWYVASWQSSPKFKKSPTFFYMRNGPVTLCPCVIFT